jgi:hypothetical protein
MKILFDFELEHYPEVPALDEKSKTTANEIREFLFQRFDAFKEQMAEQEKERGAFVILIFLEGDAQIGYHKYTDELTKKLQESLSQNDIDFLNIQLGMVTKPSLVKGVKSSS